MGAAVGSCYTVSGTNDSWPRTRWALGSDLIPHIGVGRSHVHLKAQSGRALLHPPLAHFLEQIQAFLRRIKAKTRQDKTNHTIVLDRD